MIQVMKATWSRWKRLVTDIPQQVLAKIKITSPGPIFRTQLISLRCLYTLVRGVVYRLEMSYQSWSRYFLDEYAWVQLLDVLVVEGWPRKGV